MMGLIEIFPNLPANTLVGADWKTFQAVLEVDTLHPKKRVKVP